MEVLGAASPGGTAAASKAAPFRETATKFLVAKFPSAVSNQGSSKKYSREELTCLQSN